jgi:hypothetical protein
MKIEKSIGNVREGDLVCCIWNDASIGKSSDSGLAIDVPVQSWGVFLGLIGTKVKHIVLVQNSFRYAENLFDLDYTAIPYGWAVEVFVLDKEYVPKEALRKLVNSFLNGGNQALHRARVSRKPLYQQRLSINGRPH